MLPPILPRPINPSCIVVSFLNPLENLVALKLQAQSTRAFKTNGRHSRCSRSGCILRAVVDEKFAPGRSSQNIESPLVDGRLRLAQTKIAGTQRHIDAVANAV